MAYTADVPRWSGPTENDYRRPGMMESPWHPGWIALTVLGFIMLGDALGDALDPKGRASK